MLAKHVSCSEDKCQESLPQAKSAEARVIFLFPIGVPFEDVLPDTDT